MRRRKRQRAWAYSSFIHAYRESHSRPLPPSCASREPFKLGDGKYLILLSAVLLPGLYAVFTDSDTDVTSALHPHACYHTYWFVSFLCLALSVLLFLHLLVWLFPRPVSSVDKSPLSGVVVSIVVGGPPVFAVWAAYILLIADEPRGHCSYAKHQAVWNYIYAVAALGMVAAAACIVEFTRIVLLVIRSKSAVTPDAPAAGTTAGTFTSDPKAMLDNGRWLTMESRKIKSQQQHQQ